MENKLQKMNLWISSRKIGCQKLPNYGHATEAKKNVGENGRRATP